MAAREGGGEVAGGVAVEVVGVVGVARGEDLGGDLGVVDDGVGG